jgi:hypothetical protein
MEPTRKKPMGRLPGTPGNAWRSAWFWRILVLSVAITCGGAFLADTRPQQAAVLVSLGLPAWCSRW